MLGRAWIMYLSRAFLVYCLVTPQTHIRLFMCAGAFLTGGLIYGFKLTLFLGDLAAVNI